MPVSLRGMHPKPRGGCGTRKRPTAFCQCPICLEKRRINREARRQTRPPKQVAVAAFRWRCWNCQIPVIDLPTCPRCGTDRLAGATLKKART